MSIEEKIREILRKYGMFKQDKCVAEILALIEQREREVWGAARNEIKITGTGLLIDDLEYKYANLEAYKNSKP